MATLAHKDPALPPLPCCEQEADWLALLSSLNAGQAHCLLQVARTLCPHDKLPEPVYRRVVLQLDRAWQRAPAALDSVLGLLTRLDRVFPLPFVQLSESYRVSALKSLEASPAFRLVQRGTVRHLYDDLVVWQAFGYEGAAYHLGGYLQRGFDDLDWLPLLPESHAPEAGR
jgi:hypothetical protein